MSKQVAFYRCRHCQKGWPTAAQAELCFELDMKELMAEKQCSPCQKRNGTTPRVNGHKHN